MIILKTAAWGTMVAVFALPLGMIVASLAVAINSIMLAGPHALKLQDWPANPVTSCTYRPDWSDQKFSCRSKG